MSIKLNDSTNIPILGLGTWQSPPEQVYSAVLHALRTGYRHIDTAFAYDNEPAIGRAIKDLGIPRHELFITTKLWCTHHQTPQRGLQLSLDRLGVDYVDLYLMHWPVGLNPEGNHDKFPTLPSGKRDIIHDWDFIKTWEKMQELVGNGTTSIGVSNFDIVNLDRLLAAPLTTITPVVDQVELHPLLPQPQLLQYARDHGIVMEAYSPLGSTDSPLLKMRELAEVAEKYGVGVASVLISWAVWRGTVVLPKSVNPERIESNFRIVDLEDVDGRLIDGIHKKVGLKRVVNPDWDPVVVFHSDE